MSTSTSSDNGQRIRGNVPFYIKKRGGKPRGIDFTYEALGIHGSSVEREQLEEMRRAAGPVWAGMYSENNLPALRQETLAMQMSELHGQLVLEADYLEGIHINKRFLWNNVGGFRLNIGAVQEGDLFFSTNLEGNVTGCYNVELHARLNGLTLFHGCLPGGSARKNVVVECRHTVPIQITVKGNVNYCDWTLGILGPNIGDVVVKPDGALSAKMRGRKLIVRDDITEANRTVFLEDVPA